MNNVKSKTKIQRPQTAGILRSPPATSTPSPARPSSHQAHRCRKTKRSAHVERPPVPAWMLDTPLYSKVPMVAAPAGKIMLYTTGLCDKLHMTPRGFEFDPSPQGLSMTYRSLHDPNLKGYYTTPRMYSHLMRSGFLTPCGMVKCSLKEFNEYHQYEKQVQLEQMTQQRKYMLKKHFDYRMHTHHHKLTHKKRAAPQQVATASSKHHRRSSTKSLLRSSGEVKTGRVSKATPKKGGIAKTRTPAGSVTQAHREKKQHKQEKKQHKHRKTRRSREMKAYERQSLLFSKCFDDEMRRQQELERRKLVKMAERELKLHEQWDRREASRQAQQVLETSRREKEEAKASKVKTMRSKMVEAHQARQKAIFESIRDARSRLVAQREAIIARRLEKRLDKIRRKYNRHYRRQWAALKHLVASKADGKFTDAEQELHSEDEMYSSDEVTAALERTAKYLSSGLSSPTVSSSFSDEDVAFTSLKKEQPDLTITDKVLSVSSLDYRKSPLPDNLSEEAGGSSMMRDVYLADDIGKEDGNLQGAGAVSPGIPAISSGTGVADEMSEGSSSTASMQSTSESSSSNTSLEDRSVKDEESASRKELGDAKKMGKGSEDETSKEESKAPSSFEKFEDASSEKSDFWKSESEVSLQEGSLSSFSEEENGEVVREDLEEEKKIKEAAKAKLEATVQADEGDVEKQEIKGKTKDGEEKPGAEQLVGTKEVQEEADDNLEIEKVQEDVEVEDVIEENPKAEEKDGPKMLKASEHGEEKDELQIVANGEDTDQVMKEESKTQKQRKDQELEQKVEIREELQDDNVEQPVRDAKVEKYEKGKLEIQQEVGEKEETTEIETEIQKKNMNGYARDEEKGKEQVETEKLIVSGNKEIIAKIEAKRKKKIEDELKQGEENTQVGEGKVEEKQIVRQASDVVTCVMERSLCHLTICTTGHEEETENGHQISQKAIGQSGTQGVTKEKEETAQLASDSILLANVINILEEVEHEIHHHHHHDGHDHEYHHHEHHTHPLPDVGKDEQHDNENGEIKSDSGSGSECVSFSSSDSDEQEGEIIGVVENEIIAVEGSVTSLKGCLSGESVPGLTEVVKETDDHRIIFEGALMSLKHHSSTSTASSKVSINVTAAVLSAGSLKMDSSGRLKHDMASHSHTKPELKISTTDIAHPCEPDKEAPTESSHHHYSSIVPVYHDNLINVGEELIDANLSAISMKPDCHHKVPSSYSTGSRNSFRNIFRPDMTYCQGSAKCLKDTLVRELSHSKHSKHSSSDEMDKYYDILEEEQEDVTAHHSEEELVTADDSEGVCYLPKRRTYKIRHTIEAAVHEQDEVYDEIQPFEVTVATGEVKMAVTGDSSEIKPLPTQINVPGDTALNKAETEPQTKSSNQVVDPDNKTKHEDEQTFRDELTSDGSCDDTWVMVKCPPSQEAESKIHADLDQTDAGLSGVDASKVEAQSVEDKPGPCKENISGCDKGPTEGDTEVGEAAITADRQSSNGLIPETEGQDLGVIANEFSELVNDGNNGLAQEEYSEESGNFGIVETVDRSSSSTPTPETKIPDHGGVTNGPCEVNTVEEVNEMAGHRSDRQHDGNEEEKTECKLNPDNPPDTADVTHPGDSCPEVTCLHENFQSYTSTASLSSSMTLPISCGETPASASSDMFSDFEPVHQNPRLLPNTILDSMDDLSHTPTVQLPNSASNTDSEESHEKSDKQGSIRADGNKSDPSSPPGSASDIPTVSSHHAVSESKSSSSRKSNSRMSAVMKKISSVFSLGRKHSSRVHPGKEGENEAKRKAKDEDAEEN